ncbi:NADH-quinone oxidoreductase subunit NuoE [Halothermothrix orenii]|uniref:NADH dehydrogenase (Ubiquinone) 24 kDa subunit n=1 Tax=Halothermothrix orenii (strain H 168 / OCM 544 / DSM 9562) TaxID=373903 RepID=B8D2G1_HALOH|nr:NADH-quinone oxidoreductase subunit NuoE [Halothermothrix orenii]ACL69388.1 NADH dehydrogenase (ubiquinone) 24 kDa subunit [Halothermothrix orenii H 168]
MAVKEFENCKDRYLKKLDEIILKYKDKPGPLIPVLHEAQELYGYLPEEVQSYIAEGLGVPVSKVSGVVSFYSFFTTKPKGEHTINVCMGTACYVKGAEEILNRLKEELGIEEGETSEDGKFTMVGMRCLGACSLAPVVTIDDKVYGKVTPEKMMEIIESYRK